MKALLGIRQGQEETPLGEPGLHPSLQAVPGELRQSPRARDAVGLHTQNQHSGKKSVQEGSCLRGTRVKKSGVLFTFKGPRQICIGEGKGAQ